MQEKEEKPEVNEPKPERYLPDTIPPPEKKKSGFDMPLNGKVILILILMCAAVSYVVLSFAGVTKPVFEKNLANMNTTLSDVTATINDKVSQVNNTVQSIPTTVTNTVNQSLSNYANQINTMSSQVSSFSSSINEIKQDTQDVERTLNSLNTAISTLQTDLTQAKSTISSYENRIKALETQTTTSNTTGTSGTSQVAIKITTQGSTLAVSSENTTWALGYVKVVITNNTGKDISDIMLNLNLRTEGIPNASQFVLSGETAWIANSTHYSWDNTVEFRNSGWGLNILAGKTKTMYLTLKVVGNSSANYTNTYYQYEVTGEVTSYS